MENLMEQKLDFNLGDDFKKVEKKCKEYEDENCENVFKKIKDAYNSWIVILRKISNTAHEESTITNEDRKGIKDSSRAKYRANKLKVIMIINMQNPSITEKMVIGKYYGIYTTYEVGKVVYPDSFNNDLDQDCTNGIHYFKTLEPAYFYNEHPPLYTGFFARWFSSGEKQTEGHIINGSKTGIWNYYWPDGQIQWTGNYTNNYEEGTWIFSSREGIKENISYKKGVRIIEKK